MDEGKEGTVEKQKNGQFVRKMPETAVEKETWNWPKTADLKVEKEAMFRINYVKYKIDKTAQSTICTMCHKKIVRACEKLIQKESREGMIMLQE